MRDAIFRVASATAGVGRLEETLKWGEPAYLTPETKSGSTIRLGWKKAQPDRCCLYFNCNTTLVETFRAQFAELEFEGKRAVVLNVAAPLPHAVEDCIETALTYHLR